MRLSPSSCCMLRRLSEDALAKTKKRLLDPRQEEQEKRVVLETIVSLLPEEKNALSVSFLSMLLRSSLYLETTVACRLDLENRMALQLSQAVVDDLLIPSYSSSDNRGQASFDVDTVRRIMINYLDYYYALEGNKDQNVSVSTFVTLVDVIPKQSRRTEDWIYKAIDVFLKSHPDLSDTERKKVCSVMDCQKLSREACAHAAQNDRLPAQTVVQALYYEQQRFREAPNNKEETPMISSSIKVSSTDAKQASDDLMNLRRENADLKSELVKMKMKMKEMGTLNSPSSGSSSVTTSSADKPRKSLISSVSKKLGKLYPFGRGDPASKARPRSNKVRRHSIS